MGNNLEALSEKEIKIYKFIKDNTGFVTVKLVEEQLGSEYLGAIGKLIREGIIEKTKKRLENVTNPYGRKMIKGFIIKEGETNNV